MVRAETGSLIGSWAFLIGIILAIILGAFGQLSSGILVALVIIGIIVGLLNIADREATPFLLSGAVLVIVAYYGREIMSVIPLLANILDALLALFVPATIIVAIKNVFTIARS